MPFAAPVATHFQTTPRIPLTSLFHSLEAMTEFIKPRDIHGYVLRFGDWWLHHGKPEPQETLSWEDYIARYRSHAVPGPLPRQEKIDMGIGGAEMEWYLRYTVDPVDGSASVELTGPSDWEADFADVAESLAPIQWTTRPAEEYFRALRDQGAA